MKAIIGLVCALLLASTHCQQAITLENCLYSIGVLAADISLVYRDRQNPQFLSKARADLETLYQQCRVVLPSNLGSPSKFVATKKMLSEKLAAKVAKKPVISKMSAANKSLGGYIPAEVDHTLKTLSVEERKAVLAKWAASHKAAREASANDIVTKTKAVAAANKQQLGMTFYDLIMGPIFLTYNFLEGHSELARKFFDWLSSLDRIQILAIIKDLPLDRRSMIYEMWKKASLISK